MGWAVGWWSRDIDISIGLAGLEFFLFFRLTASILSFGPRESIVGKISGGLILGFHITSNGGPVFLM